MKNRLYIEIIKAISFSMVLVHLLFSWVYWDFFWTVGYGQKAIPIAMVVILALRICTIKNIIWK